MRNVSATGHFGELLQGRLGPNGPVVLVTLPNPQAALHLTWQKGQFAIHQSGSHLWSRTGLVRFLRRVGLPVAGRFSFAGNLPVGCGAGSSTLARLIVLRALRPAMALHRMEHVIWQDEGASDPLARRYPERWLWASRSGRALAPMPALPLMRVVGGVLGAPVWTNPHDTAFPDVSDLVAAWPHACRAAQDVAALATESALRTAHLRGRDLTALQSIMWQTGALGMTMAHTGAVQAVLLDPAADPRPALSAFQRAGATHLSSFLVGGGHVR